jgi:hypothetical protein
VKRVPAGESDPDLMAVGATDETALVA